MSDFHSQIEAAYPFENSQLLSAYDSIQIIGNQAYHDTVLNNQIDLFNATYNQNLFKSKKPFVKLDFKAFNKTVTTWALLDSIDVAPVAGNNAYLLLTGTGTNQLTNLALSPYNYHNTNCFVRNHLKMVGDVYIMTTADEENRAIYFNNKKLGRYGPGQPPYISKYLDSLQKSIGVNKLIETIAMVKYLKTKYDRVFVMGLSTGGTEALWVSLLSEPHGALVSSGYSTLCDSDANSLLINSYYYSHYLEYFNRDTLKNMMSNSSTTFLFTQAQNDNPFIQLEIDSNYTPQYFAGLYNVYFNYSYTNHAFPPCGIIDTFIDKVLSIAPANTNDAVHSSESFTFNNPVNYTLQIQFNDQESNENTVELFDLYGKSVLKEKTRKKLNLFNIGHLPAGLYILHIGGEKDYKTEKVLKI
ncbi:MAG: T9SS type A sorting domain-containing protein [Bacteroidetes bacterium]|nr:T9SS type A sorting domain-containing protein [Bacteroidota bacterium]MBK8145685.1 T9SS type A sorting domain-containing protein [Bacteroidota bacterium]MBP6313958.1 T9SS type A sorting domain-containing protein [Chitinophagaceae bacterium]